MGHELRRPITENLSNDIYELRIRFGSVNYRILYFFHGRTAAILAHGLTKEAKVPDKDINIAVERRKKYIADPKEHSGIIEDEEDDEQDEQRN
jgi:phage-related protein